MKHIGLDVHSTTTDACVRNDKGVIVFSRRIKTTARELKKVLAEIGGPSRVVLEEDQMADWVTRVLEPHVVEVIRCQPRHNKLISGSEDKCDKMDAARLSELLFLNRVKRVHHPAMKYRTLRESVRAFWIASRELTRAKNRLKAWLLFNGLHKPGPSVYGVRNREVLLARLRRKNGCNVALAELLYQRMDHCRELKAKHICMLRQTARPVRRQARLLMSIPGIGVISAYTLVAYLEGGRRFPNKRKLWRYCGLSLRRYESRNRGFEGASRTGNRNVKRVLMSAAMTIVARGESNGLLALWQRDMDQSVDPKRARRNLARKIAVVAQHLLRSKQEYQDERLMM